jgi:hypothetical protein
MICIEGKHQHGSERLRSFGDMAGVKSTTKMQAKLENKGFPPIYLGSSEDHKGDTNIFWNPQKTQH